MYRYMYISLLFAFLNGPSSNIEPICPSILGCMRRQPGIEIIAGSSPLGHANAKNLESSSTAKGINKNK